MVKRKILLINKFYHDIGPAGGVGRYLVQEEEDLASAGWEVIPFAMADEHARPSLWDRYFVKARDYSRPRFGLGAIGDALSLIWNTEAARRLDALIREAKPDVAHLHNIYHHLSPSILPVLRRHGIPAVMTLHDLRLLCPAIHMLRNGHPCEDCRGGHFHNAVRGRCVKESRAASLLAAVETLHQRSRRLYESNVSVFLCPSRFIKSKYADWGFPADRLRYLRNFVDLAAWHPRLIPTDMAKDAYIYFGRISPEKGLRTLLEAQALWERQHASGICDQPPLQLLIAGSGPCLENMRAHMARLKLTTAEYLGTLDLTGLRRALGRARFSVLPSECYENGPMAALESLACGVPVVGTDIGGIPEMIDDGTTGLVAPVADAEGLLATLQRASTLPAEARLQARIWAERHADRAQHMATLADLLTEISDQRA